MTDRERIEYNNGIISGAVIRRGISSVVPFKTSAPTLPNITEAERAVFEKGLISGLTLDKDLPLESGAQTVPEGALTLTYYLTSSTSLSPFLYLDADALTIDWGDGTVDNERSHSYSSLGEKTIHVYLTNLRVIRFSAALRVMHSPFPYCPDVTSFSWCFYNCKSLTSIPAGLFDNCPNVTNFGWCFYNCESLTSIPAGLFDNCPNVTDFSSCFYNCGSLTSIPAGLFDNCPNVTSFGLCFYNCESLTSIPAGLFDNCPNVTGFGSCFYNCRLLRGDAPQLWLRTNVLSHAQCFRACIGLSNFDEIPPDWK